MDDATHQTHDAKGADQKAGWRYALPFDPDELGVLWRGLSASTIVHVALAGGFLVYGLGLSGSGTLVPVMQAEAKRPIPARFVFEPPKDDLKPHLVPQQTATTTVEPEKKRVIEPKVATKAPAKKVRTANRKVRKRARKVRQTPKPVATTIAVAVESTAATTVAPEPIAHPQLASGPATAAPPAPLVVTETSTVDRKGLLKAYVTKLSTAVRKRRAYPRAAKLAGLEGRAVVRIMLDANGTIVGIELASSSGHDILDRAAMEAARSVGKLPAAPHDLEWGTRAVNVPFRFRVTT